MPSFLDYCRDSDTPLIYSSYNGDLASVKLLIENGASASVKNRVNATPVWNASFGGHDAVLRYLISAGNPPLSVASRGMDQHSGGPMARLIYEVERTPLYVALVERHYDIAEILLTSGVSMLEERWYWNDDMPDGLDERWIQRLRDVAHNAPTLMNNLRRYLRRLLGCNIVTVVPQLEIPATLKDFLLLKSH
jgi:hypothetical protein